MTEVYERKYSFISGSREKAHMTDARGIMRGKSTINGCSTLGFGE